MNAQEIEHVEGHQNHRVDLGVASDGERLAAFQL